MKHKDISRKGISTHKPSWIRASISFPPSLYETLADLAKTKKVSVAWVVRDAAEKYVVGESGKGRSV
jgi:hypothetical protein